MKLIKAISILALITMLTACTSQAISSAPADASAPTAEQSVTEEPAEPEYSVDLVLTIIFPNKTKYTSTDNGVTWSTDSIPELYLSLSGNAVSLRCTSRDGVRGELTAGLSCRQNGTWADIDCPDLLKVPDSIFENEGMYDGAVLDFFPDLSAQPEGQYKFTAKLGEYSCALEFTLPAAGLYNGIQLITVSPDGKEWTSSDGVNWSSDGTECEAPPMYLAPCGDAEFSFSGTPAAAILHNISAGEHSGSLYGSLYRSENGNWLPAERLSTSSLPHQDMQRTLFSGLGYEVSVNLSTYQPTEGRYRYTVPFSGYECSIEFNAVK